MQKKALQAVGEVFLAIALMHASLRLRYLVVYQLAAGNSPELRIR
jgi:hypothetical protein